jgi:uncharacterized protein
MDLNQYMGPIVGGALIGLAASLLLLLQGRIFGISGIAANALFSRSVDAKWQWSIIAGLVASGFVLMKILPGGLVLDQSFGTLRYVVAGLLVGFGTQLGSGCTSGHGVCGISRFSVRSLIATACFIGAGIATVSIIGR